MAKALTAANPKRRRHRVLEDNDRTGYKSKKGVDAKVAAKISVFAIPKRSPDLNPCDFSLWSAVNRRMRQQERKFAKNKKETRAQYIARLRKTAMSLPKKVIDDMIASLAKRSKLLLQSKGHHFQEGS